MWHYFLILAEVTAFSLPGVAPKDYEEGSKIELSVNKLDSSETQLPFDYYYLNFCKPAHLEKKNENLGQILSGDRQESSPYEIYMKINQNCKYLGTMKNNHDQVENFKWMIDNQYRASWMMDNLPSGLRLTATFENSEPKRLSFYQDGFPIGFKKDGKYFVNNHAHIIVKVYNTYQGNGQSPDTWRVVGFLVEPLSFYNKNPENLKCNEVDFNDYLEYSRELEEQFVNPEEIVENGFDGYMTGILYQILEKDKNITYTYSVTFEKSNIQWAHRWEMYLYSGVNKDVHWLSVINSFAMVLFLSGMVANILRRTINKDISRYNENIDNEEESGWKQISGDIFRPPSHPMFLSILIGSGIQVIGMAILTLIFACLGFLSPAHRGSLLTTAIVLFAFMGVFGGYIASRFYKMFDGVNWKSCAMGTAFFFPGLCFIMFFVINLLIRSEESSGAVPFFTLLSLLVLWFGISVPLVFLGSAMGYRKPIIQVPWKINKIPRPLSTMTGSWKISLIGLLAGSLPFGCMFIEISYIMKSLWHHTLFYYLFGFLFLCCIVLVITSAEVSILLVYLLLCKEDYRWWWLSAWVSGSSGIYLFFYAIIYYSSELNISRFSSSVIYFGYMFLGSIAFGIVTSTIGFLAAYIFVRRIYSLIKLD